jgi:hypothetical protein
MGLVEFSEPFAALLLNQKSGKVYLMGFFPRRGFNKEMRK